MFILSGHTRSHAPLFRCGVSSPPPSTLCCYNLPMAASCRIAIVGDVHDDWSLEEDTKALQLLKPDLVLFTGDFGNENVDLVGSISNLEFTKAIILGNHDAWNTQKFSVRVRERKACKSKMVIMSTDTQHINPVIGKNVLSVYLGQEGKKMLFNCSLNRK